MRIRQEGFLGVFTILALSVSLHAASLKGTVYLSLPWGDQPGHVGRSLPHPKEGDYETAGPVGFAIASNGDVYLSDLQAFRVQVFKPDGSLRYQIQFSTTNPDLIEDIDVDPSGRMYLVGDFGAVGKGRKSKLQIYSADFHLIQDLDLNALGFQSPLNIELSTTAQSIFIQDNGTFRTSEVTLSGRLLAQAEKDVRLYWLASKGLYLIRETRKTVRILSPAGQFLKEYSKDNGQPAIPGVSQNRTLYILYKSTSSVQGAEQPAVWLDGLQPEGRILFSIPIVDKPARSLLDPDRAWDIRVFRVGPDNAIYVMGDPEDDQFHIYRYEIKE